jgi:lysophospholipase L1-like esterase
LNDGDRVVYYGNTLLERDRHYGMLETMLRTRFPGRKLTFRNLAWPGDTVNVQLRPLNFGNMESHLRAQKPTVVFVSFGMNEAHQGPAGLNSYLEGYRRQLTMLQRLQARLILLSPIRQEQLTPPLPATKVYNAHAGLYHQATQNLAAQMGLTYLDLYSTLITESPADPPLTDNGIHLNRYGYWRFSELIAQCLGLSTRWEVKLDFAQHSATAQGTQLSKLSWHADGLSFVATDLVLPNPVPDGYPEELDRQAGHRRLVIQGLPAGNYQLFADNHLIAQGTHQDWSRGIVLTADPTYQRARQLRNKVIEKDLLFFHRWRAHNGEYIYGRRSKPGGGNSGNPTFPAEFAELDKLLSEADRQLDELATPKPITYVLRRFQR